MIISGMDRAIILAALYNRAQVQGMGFLQYTPEDMSVEEARGIIDHRRLSNQDLYFDYLKGRVMKIDLSGNETDTRLYNRDNGQGAAEKVMADIREKYRQDPESFKR